LGWNGGHLRLISVKRGVSNYASAIEREALATMPAPAGTTREIWRLPDRQAPRIEVL
jgi:hypothetical protein